MSLIGGAAAWEIVGVYAGGLLLPRFSETVAALWWLSLRRELWAALWDSNAALALGFTAAALFGVSAGFALARWPLAERLIDPYLTLLLAVPMAGAMPLVLMALGVGLPARTFVVFIFAVGVLIVNARAGLQRTDLQLVEMARMFGASDLQVWRRVRLPAAIPAVMAGMRLGLARALTGMVVVELLMVAVGIGRLILVFQADFEAPSVYAVVLVVTAEAALLLRLTRALERRVAPWHSHVFDA